MGVATRNFHESETKLSGGNTWFRGLGLKVLGGFLWVLDRKKVQKKPGSRAKDVYLVYCQKGVVGSDQQHPCWTFSAKYTSAMKKQDSSVEGRDPNSQLSLKVRKPEGCCNAGCRARPVNASRDDRSDCDFTPVS